MLFVPCVKVELVVRGGEATLNSTSTSNTANRDRDNQSRIKTR